MSVRIILMAVSTTAAKKIILLFSFSGSSWASKSKWNKVNDDSTLK